MIEVDRILLKTLKQQTCLNVLECREALIINDNDYDKALAYLKEKFKPLYQMDINRIPLVNWLEATEIRKGVGKNKCGKNQS